MPKEIMVTYIGGLWDGRVEPRRPGSCIVLEVERASGGFGKQTYEYTSFDEKACTATMRLAKGSFRRSAKQQQQLKQRREEESRKFYIEASIRFLKAQGYRVTKARKRA